MRLGQRRLKMIRPTNIDEVAHTADFKCDQHDAYVTGLDLNSVAEYVTGPDGFQVIQIDSAMLDSGTELALCKEASFFPVLNGNVDAVKLNTAKTI